MTSFQNLVDRNQHHTNDKLLFHLENQLKNMFHDDRALYEVNICSVYKHLDLYSIDYIYFKFAICIFKLEKQYGSGFHV